MDGFIEAVEMITSAKEDIRKTIQNPDIDWLLATSACSRCVRFLVAFYATDARNGAERLLRYEAGRLLFVLAAMEGENEHDTLEALRLMGAKGVDARVPKLQRYRKAGEARERPVTDPRHYDRYGHLERAQQWLATELHSLVVRPDRLEAALEINGTAAVVKYL
jgi:hypothetical protein